MALAIRSRRSGLARQAKGVLTENTTLQDHSDLALLIR